MKDFPSCFGESVVQIASSSPSTATITAKAAAQNLVTCVYQYQSKAISGFITVTWIKHLMGQGLTVGIENSTKELCKVDIKTWLFSKRKGLKNLVLDSITVDIHWDLSSAKFSSGPEPLEGFYVAILLNQELCLLVGDLINEAYRRMDSTAPSCVSKGIFVAKREHIFGKRLYSSKAQFCDKGESHDVRIEYDASDSYDQCLVIYIDNKRVIQVARLKWNFRGNDTILVDGLSIEVYWDVFNWLFESVIGNAVFLFRTRVPVSQEKSSKNTLLSPGLRTSIDSYNSQCHGFSLVLCAWKNE